MEEVCCCEMAGGWKCKLHKRITQVDISQVSEIEVPVGVMDRWCLLWGRCTSLGGDVGVGEGET